MNNLAEGTRVRIKIANVIVDGIVAEPFDPIFPANILILDHAISTSDDQGVPLNSFSADQTTYQKHFEQLARHYGISPYTDRFWRWQKNTILITVLPDQSQIETLRCIPVTQPAGYNCHLCNQRNDYAEPNAIVNGRSVYRCFDCRC